MPHIYRQLLYYESFVYILWDRVVPSLSRETFTRNKSFIYLSVIILLWRRKQWNITQRPNWILKSQSNPLNMRWPCFASICAILHSVVYNGAIYRHHNIISFYQCYYNLHNAKALFHENWYIDFKILSSYSYWR